MVLPAIEFAKLAERYRWLIIVKEKCFSSCANYVFLARTKKVVLPQSLVGWHGLPQEPSDFSPIEFEKIQASGRLTEWNFLDVKKIMLAEYVDTKEFLAERGIPRELCEVSSASRTFGGVRGPSASLDGFRRPPTLELRQEGFGEKVQCPGHSLHVGAPNT